MQWKNSTTRFGLITVILHWLVALTVVGLFGLGLWMTGLDYYDTWYRQAPALHKSIGILLFFVVIFRLYWRTITPLPVAVSSHKPWEVSLARITPRLLYLLLLAIMLSGYLISTADNRSIEVFGWFSIPATITSIPAQRRADLTRRYQACGNRSGSDRFRQ
jgi:cytochrome b561